jgi:hypothetical protein
MRFAGMLANRRDDHFPHVFGPAARMSAAAEKNNFRIFAERKPKAEVQVGFGPGARTGTSL